MKRMLATLILTVPMVAQNSDLSFLAGVGVRKAEIRNGVIRTEESASFQINYAWQLREGPAGRLYIEVPVQFLASTTSVVNQGVRGVAGASVFILPGLRYHYNLHPRLAVYAAAGAGFGTRAQSLGIVQGNNVTSLDQWVVSAAAGFGGGLDFRLTRLWSLRTEVRNMIGRFKVSPQRSHVLGQFGVALHF